MAKKLSMLLAAVAVVAVAVPAAASANTPTLFDAAGKVAVGAKILGTSTNAVTKTSLGNLVCAKVTVTGRVTHNGSGTARGVGEGTGTTSTCTVNGNPIVITDITLTEIHTAASGSGTINVTFKADLPGELECHFASTGVPFTYTVAKEPAKETLAEKEAKDTLQITNGDLVATPACEPGLLTGTFTLETELPTGTGPVWIQ